MAHSEVGVGAWIHLLHAEVCWALDSAQIRPLVIKGPSIAEWLYPDEERLSADADVLIAPEEWDGAMRALKTRGFVDFADGVRKAERVPHAITFTRTDPQLGGHTVDVHRYFPGIGRDAGEAFEILWQQRVPSFEAGVPVAYPDLPARTLIIVLHSARGALSPKVLEDQRRAWDSGGSSLFSAARALASDLDALPAFRLGLEAIPETQHLVDDLGLSDVSVSPNWRLMSESATGTAVHLEELAELPLVRRPGHAIRWLFPSPATMRLRDPALGKGAWPMCRAYGARLMVGLRAAPGAFRTVRDARRR